MVLRSIVYEPWFTEAEVNRDPHGSAMGPFGTFRVVPLALFKQQILWFKPMLLFLAEDWKDDLNIFQYVSIL